MSDDEFSGNDRDKRAPRFSWTPAYEATFFRSLCESVQLGLRENHSFKVEAWDRAATALQEKHAAYPTKSHLVNKSDNARKKFRLWRGLREDAEFVYNPTSKTVTATEEAWKAHIEKEPLSRALRGRPFEHEEFMEILYPDVIGSGGAPKRIMKPKRKGPDMIQGPEDPEMPGTGILDLQVDSPYRPSSRQGMPPPPTPPPPPAPTAQQPQLQQQKQHQQRVSISQPSVVPARGQVQVPQQRPTSTTLPPRTHIPGTSALTPPEETASHGRRRFPGAHPPQQAVAGESGSMRSTTMGPPVSGHGNTGQPPEKRRRTSSFAHPDAVFSGAGPSSTSANTINTEEVAASVVTAGKQLLEEGLLRVAEALKARTPPRWPEQAMDIFFRDFADEDMDLQLKIAEKALADDNKAMVFCKMPPALRRHWVKRLRELHNNRVV
ncbi:hypothetical protein ACRALDRAFT_2044801 [Sodiomyces alcalophilus JCM 7366]|uniref:uncharacterized protein n=1 Tax=Sodiomyces alcalophilus JCM 7366 TaxID=591952 RepID=UPI0039B56075